MAQIQNLVIQSENFGASWGKGQSSITANSVANPINGLVTASTLVEDGTSNVHLVQQTITIVPGALYTASAFIQPSNRTWCAFQFGGNAVYFQLTGAGVIGQINGTPTAYSITALPNNWYRVTISYQSTTTSSILDIYAASGNGGASYQGTNGLASLNIFGAQLVQSNWAGPYVTTGATAINTGAIRNIVSQAQNLIKFSEDFTQSGTWTQTNISSVAANQIANPRNGIINVSGLIASSTSGNHLIQQAMTTAVGLPYTVSVYAKAGNQNWILIENITDFAVFYNITSGSGALGTITNCTATIQALPNGWFLCTATFIPTATSSNFDIFVATANGSTSFAGDNATINTYLYGAMLTQTAGLTEYTQTGSTSVSGGSMRRVLPQNQNFFLNSQVLAGNTLTNISVSDNTSDTLDPFGFSHATKLTDNNTNGKHRFFQSGILNPTNAGLITQSIFAKVGTVGWIVLQFNDDTAVNGAYFNLSTGAVGVTIGSAVVSTSSISYGNGWYRFSVTSNNTAHLIGLSVSYDMATGDGTESYVGGSGTIYVFGAQIVKSSAPGPYQVTGSVVVNTGSIRNKSLTRTRVAQAQNLWSYSQDFTQVSAWTTGNTNFGAFTIAPDGTNTGQGILASSTAATQKLIGQVEPVNDAGQVTVSFYVKAGATSWCSIYAEAGDEFVFFNLVGAGTISSTSSQHLILSAVGSADIKNVGNGWYRISVTKKRIFFAQTTDYCILANADGGNVYAASDTTTPQIYIWGAQYVRGNWAGPYVLTTGSVINTGSIRSLI